MRKNPQKYFFSHFSEQKFRKNRDFRSKSPVIELIPQSTTTAPGLIQSPLTNFAEPMATTKISASLIYKRGTF